MAFNSNTTEAFEALKEYMVQNHDAKIVSGGREILKRCHLCGDSRDLSSRHMYIGLKPNGSIVYNCFKCNAKGVVDGKFLRDLGCYDQGITNLCNEQNQRAESSIESKSGTLRNVFLKQSPIIPRFDDEFAVKKCQYISKRLGLSINPSSAANLKIILNLKQFLDVNRIPKYTRRPEMMELIDKFFIGFLSMDNSMVILRRLTPEGKLPEFIDHRYIDYNIFGRDDGVKYYTIPSIINPALPINIHIAEGAFDILSIRLNLCPNESNGMFMACGGKRYAEAIRFIIQSYGFIGFNLHIYPDKDVSDRAMQAIASELHPLNIKVIIHRNTFPDEKDYGVSMDKIKDTQYVF